MVVRLLQQLDLEVGQRLSAGRWAELHNELRRAGVEVADVDQTRLSATDNPGLNAKLRLRLRPTGKKKSVRKPRKRSTTAASSPAASRSVASWLRTARAEAGISQAELGRKVGVEQPTISNWENGANRPSAESIRDLERVLGPQANGSTDGSAGALAGWLSRARAESGLTAAELANESGVSLNQIYNIEKGRTQNPRQRTLKAIERVLHQSVPEETLAVTAEEATVGKIGKLIDFDPYSETDRPTCAGIYVLYDISERPIYVGQGSNISRRIRDHSDKFWFKPPIVETASYIEVEDRQAREDIERVLIRFLKSNAVINKQNVDRA
jgi:transcriptional regulator with XRE-family HTH domain